LAIAELASRQHGVVARRQLLRLGFHRDAIVRRLAQGTFIRCTEVFSPSVIVG
jgi:hypothetical protein